MLNVCGIVVAILKMETGRNFSMLVINSISGHWLHRKVEPHLKRCILVLEFSKWPPIQKLKKSLKIQK
jgi:hypothetical protein